MNKKIVFLSFFASFSLYSMESKSLIANSLSIPGETVIEIEELYSTILKADETLTENQKALLSLNLPQNQVIKTALFFLKCAPLDTIKTIFTSLFLNSCPPMLHDIIVKCAVALHRDDQEKIVEFFLDKGLPVTGNHNPLCFLSFNEGSEEKCCEIAKLLISKGACIDGILNHVNDGVPQYSNNPLLHLLRGKKWLLTNFFLTQKAQVNPRLSLAQGQSLIACLNHPDSAKILLKYGAQITQDELNSYSEVILTVIFNNEVSKDPEEHTKNPEIYIECLKILIDTLPANRKHYFMQKMWTQFFSLTDRDMDYDSFLEAACSTPRLGTCAAFEFLLSSSDILDEQVIQACRHSFILSHPEIVKLYMRMPALFRGCKLEELNDSNGFTCLHYAAAQNNTKLIHWLLSRGARADAKAGNGCTPLIIASLFRSVEAVELLVGAGANVEAQETSLNFTPLLAATSNVEDIIYVFKEPTAHPINQNDTTNNQEITTAVNESDTDREDQSDLESEEHDEEIYEESDVEQDRNSEYFDDYIKAFLKKRIDDKNAILAIIGFLESYGTNLLAQDKLTNTVIMKSLGCDPSCQILKGLVYLGNKKLVAETNSVSTSLQTQAATAHAEPYFIPHTLWDPATVERPIVLAINKVLLEKKTQNHSFNEFLKKREITGHSPFKKKRKISAKKENEKANTNHT